MRTWKWIITASLLISLGAMAQQTTAPSPQTQPRSSERSAIDRQHARDPVPRRRRGCAHHHGPGGRPGHIARACAHHFSDNPHPAGRNLFAESEA